MQAMRVETQSAKCRRFLERGWVYALPFESEWTRFEEAAPK